MGSAYQSSDEPPDTCRNWYLPAIVHPEAVDILMRYPPAPKRPRSSAEAGNNGNSAALNGDQARRCVSGTGTPEKLSGLRLNLTDVMARGLMLISAC